jgi:predicted CopG family antitoxin
VICRHGVRCRAAEPEILGREEHGLHNAAEGLDVGGIAGDVIEDQAVVPVRGGELESRPFFAIDFPCEFMHDSCMATKTISLEIDAYERLRKARRTPSESFSSVVRRALFPGTPSTAGEILEISRRRMEEGRALLSPESLDRLDAAQQQPRSSESHWAGT